MRGRDPFPGADQRVPGAFPHIRQVHGVDPVGHLAHAAQVLPFHAGGAGAGLDLAGFVDRADRQAAPPPGLAGGLIQPGHGEPAHHPHRREGVPDCPVEQPLRPVRRAVSRTLGDRPPVPSAQVAHHRGGVLARLQPRLCPREARPQQFQQLSAFPAPQRGAYPGGSSRLRFCCPHKRMIDRRLRCANRFPPPCSGPGQSPNGYGGDLASGHMSRYKGAELDREDEHSHCESKSQRSGRCAEAGFRRHRGHEKRGSTGTSADTTDPGRSANICACSSSGCPGSPSPAALSRPTRRSR